MYLEDAYKIKNICNNIDEIDEMLDDISHCSWLTISIHHGKTTTNSYRVKVSDKIGQDIISDLKDKKEAFIKRIYDLEYIKDGVK